MSECCYTSFFFNDTATTEIYTLSLHDALPILYGTLKSEVQRVLDQGQHVIMDIDVQGAKAFHAAFPASVLILDRKSTRLNSSHANISYAVFCLKKKKRPHTYMWIFVGHNNPPT